MSEENQGFNIPINSKTIGTLIGILVMVAGIVGTWYITKEKIILLEAKTTVIEKKLDEKVATKSTLTRIENESKERDAALKEEHDESVDSINEKMEQIEDTVHGTQLTVGTISRDVKNVSADINEMKQDIRAIRNSIKRRR